MRTLYIWHDLELNPDDLPPESCTVLIATRKFQKEYDATAFYYAVAVWDEEHGFRTTDYELEPDDPDSVPVAWRYFDNFTGGKTEVLNGNS